MKRVFFYTGFHMEVFEFDRNVLIGSLDFYDTDLGAEQLREYILQSTQAPSYMLVDLQDEDFRNELVPHVKGNDRKQLIERLEGKIFRDVSYHHTMSLGRSKEGRKDDQFMFSSLLNVEALDKWMSIFADLDVPICGIWSVSYLGERILKKISAKEDNILLFSRQMRSAIRETVFKHGKITISRQAKLERRIRKENSAETLATILASNVDTMHRFLINQRLLGYADVLNVYAIVGDEFIDKTKEYCEDSNVLKFKFLGIKELFELFNIKNTNKYEANTLFAYLCSLEQSRQQQYLPSQHRGPHKRYNLNLAVRNISLILSLSFSIIASFFLLNANEYSNSKALLSAKKAQLVEEHERLYGDKEEKINNAELLKETVQLMQFIEQQNAHTPQSMFAALSEIYDSPENQRFSLDEIQWQKYRPEQLQAIASEYSDLSKIQSEDEYYDDEYQNIEYGFQTALVISGKLDRSNLNYQQAVEITENFMRAISKIDNVSELHVLLSPIDIRIASKFIDRSGIDQEQGKIEETNNMYEFRIIFSSFTNNENENDIEN